MHYQNKVAAVPSAMDIQETVENTHIFDFELAPADMERFRLMNCDFRVRYSPDTVDFNTV